MSGKHTPPSPPASKGEKRQERTPPLTPKKKQAPSINTTRRTKVSGDSTVRRVIRHLLSGKDGSLKTAEVILREYNSALEQWQKNKHQIQIRRIEDYFREITGHDAWPENLLPGQGHFWRGKIGAVINSGVPLSRLLEDIKANPGKRSLIYFLSTEQGTKASRWEMLSVDYREEQWKADKKRYAEEAKTAWERIMGKDEGGGMKDEMVKPTWMIRLEAEIKQMEDLIKNDGLISHRTKADYQERIKKLKLQIARWEQRQR